MEETAAEAYRSLRNRKKLEAIDKALGEIELILARAELLTGKDTEE
jgi:hypothetical protein